MDLNASFSELVEKLSSWAEGLLLLLLPNFVIAVLIVLVAAAAARIARRGSIRLLGRVSDYTQVNKLFSTLIYLTILGTGLFIALETLGLSKAVTTLLAGIGIVGLALGFAFQDIASNFIAGVMMAFRRPLQVNDVVETNEYSGVVEDVNLRTTIVRTFDGKHVLIPNSSVIQNPLVNYSRSPDLRVDLRCGVAYGDDLEAAERIAVSAVEGITERDPSRPVQLFWEEFGDSSINFVVVFWIMYRKQVDYLKARSAAIKRLKAAFDESGITIPFPIRTLDFGVVGGEKLNEVLPRLEIDRRD